MSNFTPPEYKLLCVATGEEFEYAGIYERDDIRAFVMKSKQEPDVYVVGIMPDGDEKNMYAFIIKTNDIDDITKILQERCGIMLYKRSSVTGSSRFCMGIIYRNYRCRIIDFESYGSFVHNLPPVTQQLP